MKIPIHTVPGALAGTVRQDKPEHSMSQMPVTCVTTIDVPVHSELEIIVDTPQCAKGAWLLEGSMDDRLRVITTRAIVCPSDQVVVA